MIVQFFRNRLALYDRVNVKEWKNDLKAVFLEEFEFELFKFVFLSCERVNHGKIWFKYPWKFVQREFIKNVVESLRDEFILFDFETFEIVKFDAHLRK